MSKRLTYHHGNLRRALLEAASALLDEGGLAALSLREVARRAGVTHSAPYHYFADRSALLSAVAEEGFSLLTQALEEARDGAHEPLARFAALGCAYVGFALEYPGYFRIMFRPELADLKDCDDPDHVSHRSFRILVDVISECQEAGLAPGGDPMPLVLSAWSLVHGLASLWLDGPLSRSPLAETVSAGQLSTVVTGTMAELLGRSAATPLPAGIELPSADRWCPAITAKEEPR